MSESKKRTVKENINDGSQRFKKTKLDPENLKPCETLYIKNLNDKVNYKILKHNLYLLFSTYGDIIEINLNLKNKKMRGQAHIIYSNIKNATSAKKLLQNESFFNKPLVINYSTGKSKIIRQLEEPIEDSLEGS